MDFVVCECSGCSLPEQLLKHGYFASRASYGKPAFHVDMLEHLDISFTHFAPNVEAAAIVLEKCLPGGTISWILEYVTRCFHCTEYPQFTNFYRIPFESAWVRL